MSMISLVVKKRYDEKENENSNQSSGSSDDEEDDEDEPKPKDNKPSWISKGSPARK